MASSSHNKDVAEVRWQIDARQPCISINILPPELLLDIFERYVRSLTFDNNLPSSSQHPPYSWIRFTHVCQYWRDIALAQPSLWSCIDITSLECIAEMITRSKEYPLTIRASGWFIWKEKDMLLRSVVRLQIHRIIKLVLSDFRPAVINQVYDDIKNNPDAHLRSLVLADVVVSINQRKNTDSSSRCGLSHLERFKVTKQHLFTAQRWFCPSIRYLTLSSFTKDFSMEILLNSLEHLPRLEVLNLSELFLPRVLQPHDIHLNNPVITLPRLRSLRISEEVPHLLPLLQALHVPSLCSLSLRSGVWGINWFSTVQCIAAKINSSFRSPRSQPFLALSFLWDSSTKDIELRGWTSPDGLQIGGTILQQCPQLSITLHLPYTLFMHDSVNVFEEMCTALQLDYVRAVHVGSSNSGTKVIPCAKMFPKMELRALSIEGKLAHHLPKILQPSSSDQEAQSPLPYLEVLRLEHVMFRAEVNDVSCHSDFIDCLHGALSSRALKGFSLEKLIIQYPINFTVTDWKLFKDCAIKTVLGDFKRCDQSGKLEEAEKSGE